MSGEEFGKAYQKGFERTVRFLMSKGLTSDAARETAQCAWVRGWERLNQLRSPQMIFTWMNSIALNIYRSHLRREPAFQPLPELSAPHRADLAAIEVRRILKRCKDSDRMVLQSYYLEGNKVQEIADKLGCTELAMRIRLLRARRSVFQQLTRKPASAAARHAAPVAA